MAFCMIKNFTTISGIHYKNTYWWQKKDTKLNDGLSISDAKIELSKYYEISEENIEIHIKG